MVVSPEHVQSLHMEFDGFTARQREATIDLVVLTMYLDRNLAAVEDARIQRMLEAMGFATDYDRSREFDASVTRVRPHSESQSLARAHASHLAELLATPEQRRIVFQAIEEIVSADGSVSSQETAFLETLRSVLKG
jgi:uncharacterized tellurite resistance protein B-like protein